MWTQGSSVLHGAPFSGETWNISTTTVQPAILVQARNAAWKHIFFPNPTTVRLRGVEWLSALDWARFVLFGFRTAGRTIPVTSWHSGGGQSFSRLRALMHRHPALWRKSLRCGLWSPALSYRWMMRVQMDRAPKNTQGSPHQRKWLFWTPQRSPRPPHQMQNQLQIWLKWRNPSSPFPLWRQWLRYPQLQRTRWGSPSPPPLRWRWWLSQWWLRRRENPSSPPPRLVWQVSNCWDGRAPALHLQDGGGTGDTPGDTSPYNHQHASCH